MKFDGLIYSKIFESKLSKPCASQDFDVFINSRGQSISELADAASINWELDFWYEDLSVENTKEEGVKKNDSPKNSRHFKIS